MKTTLTVEIEYDPEMTDAEGLACAMDRLLETALSTPDILSEYGNPKVGEFFVAKEPAPPMIVLNLSGGVLQDVFGSDSATAVTLVDWDVEGCSPSDENIFGKRSPAPRRGGTCGWSRTRRGRRPS
jgi:hypothetical protein